MRLLTVLPFVLLSSLAIAQKKPLDHSVYDGWKTLQGIDLARDGKWVTYTIAPQEGNSSTEFRNVATGEIVAVPRGSDVRFTFDSKYAVLTQIPPFEETKKAKNAKAKPEDMPKNNLVIVDLASKKVSTIERVAAYQLAKEDSGYLLYKPEPPKAKPTPPPTPSPAPPADPNAKPPVPKKKAEHKPGDTWILRNLATEKEETLENVATAAFSKDGRILAYALSTKEGDGDGVVWYDVVAGQRKPVVMALGRYPKLAVQNQDHLLAFTTDKDDYAAKKPVQSLYLFDPTASKLTKIDPPTTIPGFIVSEFAPISFSEKGGRLLFGTGPKPQEDVETPDDEKVSVDIWTYQDSVLMPQQIFDLKKERERSYEAVCFIDAKKTVQLETPTLQSVTISDKGDGDTAVGSSDLPYRRAASWNPGVSDIYTVDVKSGKATKILTGFSGSVSMGPAGRYLTAYDAAAGSLSTFQMATGKKQSFAGKFPVPLSNELNDVPDYPNAYGIGGWSKDDRQVLIYDRFDIWSVDPSGGSDPHRLTNGRPFQQRYRILSLDDEDPTVDPGHLLLSIFGEEDKRGGLAWLVDGRENRVFYEDKGFSGVVKAAKADTLLYRRQDVKEYPNLWLTDVAFHAPKQITDANPQQANYNWLTNELVRWRSNDGDALQGILYKPEDFDATKSYPMITYFYERRSDTLNAYVPPAPSASSINIPYFVSNGYLVFIPDIPYKIGYPGESAVSAIVPGVNSIVDRGYVDPKRLGIQGQSWGGYQVAYLVTETNMFAAAEAGAPVGDMFSAYGGIRYESGLVRQFQYEHDQSRIDGTPWSAPLRYLENSPVFFADKIRTPLMIMSNDKDGAVPHTQGIELFTALRRLDKPSWLVVYNGEGHNIMERKNRKDFSVRIGQFFDHFLKGAPMPEWMAKGVPALEKGRNMGLSIP